MSSGIVNTVLHLTYKENIIDENPNLDLEMLPEKFFQKITILKKHFQKIKNFQEFAIKAEVFLEIAKEIHEFLSKSPELSRHQKFNYCIDRTTFHEAIFTCICLKKFVIKANQATTPYKEEERIKKIFLNHKKNYVRDGFYNIFLDEKLVLELLGHIQF